MTHRTDYEEPAAKGTFSGNALSKSNQIRLGKSRGPAQRGLALFRFTFVRTKVNPGVWGRVGPIKIRFRGGAPADKHPGTGPGRPRKKPGPIPTKRDPGAVGPRKSIVSCL